MGFVLFSGTLGSDKEDKDEKKGEGDEEEDPEIAEAKREAEEKRNEKYRKMEEEREVMRQGIRDKVELHTTFMLTCYEDPRDLHLSFARIQYLHNGVNLCAAVALLIRATPSEYLRTKATPSDWR